MKRFGTFSGRAAAVFGVLAVVATAVACEEDGKTVPERCVDLPLFDIQAAGAPADDNASLVGSDAENPCVTKVGHAVSSFGNGSAGEAPSSGGTGGSGTGGTGGTAGTSGTGSGSGGSPDAGAGGA
jgi:hypothetical protein